MPIEKKLRRGQPKKRKPALLCESIREDSVTSKLIEEDELVLDESEEEVAISSKRIRLETHSEQMSSTQSPQPFENEQTVETQLTSTEIILCKICNTQLKKRRFWYCPRGCNKLKK